MRIVSIPPFATGSIAWQEQPEQWTLTIVCKATYRLVPGTAEVAVEPEGINVTDNHWDDDPQKSLYAPSDLAPRKPRPEVLLVGNAFAPRGELVRSLHVRLAVGELDKSIEVFGDRSFGSDGVLQEGSRWTQTPLRYERAAGGLDSWNPVGVDPEVIDALGRRSLPNLQPPGIHVLEPGTTIPATGYGPISAHWNVRRAKLGALARDWSNARWTEIPLGFDFDGSYFQSAPLDQLVEELRPDEPIILENLHAEHARLVTRLPGLRPHVRVEIEGMPPWELMMVADTLWIDTNWSICTLTWRGQLPLDGRDQEGVVYIGVEDEAGKPVRWPEKTVSESPPDSEDDDLSAHTQTDAFQLERGLNSKQLRSVLPFNAHATATLPAVKPPLPPRPRREPDDPRATGAYVAPMVRSRMPTWLGGAAEPSPVPAPAIAPAPPVPARAPVQAAARPPSFAPPPPPVPQLLRRGEPAPFANTAAASNAAAGFEPLTQAPSMPAIHRPPMPSAPVTAPTIGQAAVLSAQTAQQASPIKPEPMASGAMAHPRPQKARTRIDARALASAAFLGAADASSAAAATPEEAESEVRVDELKPRQETSSDKQLAPLPVLLELIWYAPDAADRLREDPVYKEIIERRKEEKKASSDRGEEKSEDKAEENAFEDPAKADKTDIGVVISRGSPSIDVEAALSASASEDGVIEEKVVLVFGDLELPFDELETLKIVTSAAAPLASADKKLKETLDLANEIQSTPLGQSAEVAASFSLRVREAWFKANRMLPPDYLDVHSRRILLEQRKYQMRELSDAQWIRALFHGPSGTGPIPAYLPVDVAKRLPLFTRFPARMAVLVLPQQDQTESQAVALRVLALARQVQGRVRGR